MPEKQKPRDRKPAYAAVVAVAMTMLLTLWNMFASQDRSEAESPASTISLPEKELANACHTFTPNVGTGTRCMTVARTRTS